MKTIGFVICLLVSHYTGSAQTAEEILKSSCKEAEKSNKNVFIIFHASWCGWCHKMDDAMNEASIKSYFTDNYIIKHFVVQELDGSGHTNTPGADKFLEKYKGDNQGIPYWIIFDSKGNWLADSKIRPGNGGIETGENVGCPVQEKEVRHFSRVLQKTSRLQQTQLEAIESIFRKYAEN